MTDQNEQNLAQIIDSNDQSPPGANELTGDEVKMVAVEFSDIVQSVINEAQWNILKGRTPDKYKKTRPGKGGKTFTYVPHGYVTAVLNSAFGFDWDFELVPIDDKKLFLYMEGKISGKKQNPSVLVHGKLTVRIHDKKGKLIATIIKTSTGEKESIKNMSWGALLKSAESDAFKKAASRLGIALDLYWQDADEDYIPAEKLSPEMQALVDAIGTTTKQNGTLPPPVLRDILAQNGHDHPLPKVVEALTLYNKQKA